MTLRARLTAAFLAVVLGPVLLGAVFVGVTVTTVSTTRSVERLDTAERSVRAALRLECQRLRSAAESAALLTGNPHDPNHSPIGAAATGGGHGQPTTAGGEPAEVVVDRGMATAVVITGAEGGTVSVAGVAPPFPWADCDGYRSADTPPVPLPPGIAALVPQRGERPAGLSARVDVRDANGTLVAQVTAADPVTRDLVERLAGEAGVSVGIFGAGSGLSTERVTDVAAVSETARGLKGHGDRGRTASGRYVQRLDPGPQQPLTLVLSTPVAGLGRLYAALLGAVLSAGAVAVVAAWNLARSTIRPLRELAVAAERVAQGDLAARVPVRGTDEIGQLATTFNRMTRETYGYVQALTASRDQLRGQLGLVGDTLSGTHDLDRILRVIIRTAAAATGAQAGVILLVDPTGGVLVGHCAEGMVGRGKPMDIDDLRLRIGEGLLGAVAASGEPRRGRVERDGPVLATHEPHCLTYVAVPFSAPAAGPTTGLEPAGDPGTETMAACPPKGVLALYDRHGFDEFDDDDLVTLRTFASQAAVALDNVRVHEEAQRLSLTDGLTGLSNYRYLRESLRREIERASRFRHTLAVLVLDLDHFKEINDTYGHGAGDAVLAEFARRVRVEIREVDFAFRQGGEEFVVLLPETDEAGAAVVAQRLCEAVRRNPVLVVSHQSARPLRISVTVSVGVGVYPTHGESGLAVLEAADDALYAAKAAGRNTFCVAGSTGG